MKKFLCCVLAVLILGTQMPAAQSRAAGVPAVTASPVNLKSSETTAKTTTLYQSDGACYLDLKDVLTFTRASVTEDQPSGLKLKQGSRSISIDKTAGTLSEQNVENNTPVHLIETDGKTLVPAYAMLTYLGASCEFSNHTLLVSMPAYTVWEAFDFHADDYAFNTEELWGKNLSARLTCDIIMQILYGVGLFGSLDEVLENSMDDVLGVDPYQYDACVQEEKNYFSRLNQLSKRLYPKQNSSSPTEVLDTVFSSEHDTCDFWSDFLNVSAQFMDSNSGKSIKRLSGRATHFKLVFSRSEFESLSKKMGKLSTGMELTADLMNLASTVISRTNYTQDTTDSLAAFTNICPSCLSDYKSNLNYQVAAKLNKIVSGKRNIIINSTAEKALQVIADKLGNYGSDLIMGQFQSAGLLYGAFKIGTYLESLLPSTKAFIKSSDADLKAILLTGLFSDIGTCLNHQGQQIISSRYKDETQIESYRQLCEFWVKTAIAANEKLTTVVENGGNQTYLPVLKQRNQDLSVILFKLANTVGRAIPDFRTLSASKALDESIASGTNSGASDSDSAVKEKISNYLRSIAEPFQGSMPPFDNIKHINSAWAASDAWFRALGTPIQYQNYEAVSLSSLEKEAKRLINPELSLSPNADYSYFSTITPAHPQWVPSQKLFIWVGTDGPSIKWDYPITSVVRDGTRYRVTCAETYYIPSSNKMSTDPCGVIFCNGRQVGTEQDGAGGQSPVFHYTTSPSELPQIGFVLQENDSGGFYVTAKTGAQSKADFPEEDLSSESQPEEEDSDLEPWKGEFSQQLQRSWIEGGGSADGAYDNYIEFKPDGTCCFSHIQNAPLENQSLDQARSISGEYAGNYTVQGKNTVLFEGTFRDTNPQPYYTENYPNCKTAFKIEFFEKTAGKMANGQTKCMKITFLSGENPFQFVPYGESWKTQESREFWS